MLLCSRITNSRRLWEPWEGCASAMGANATKRPSAKDVLPRIVRTSANPRIGVKAMDDYVATYREGSSSVEFQNLNCPAKKY